MDITELLISKGIFNNTTLKGKVAVVTGGGGGIGYEAARALAWLGAHVVIAEINKATGLAAVEEINRQIGRKAATFFYVDISNATSIVELAEKLNQNLGQVDIVLNNATVISLGAVKEVSINNWDTSYQVNLRGPVLLAQQFLPGMLKRNYGVFVSVSSSGAAPYMGPYEVMKVAQTELAHTIAAELEGTGVYAFTIGPGLVKTTTAMDAIEKIAPLYGKTVEEFYEMSENQIISAEAAGAGFAAAIALADKFNGQEIGSTQALHVAGINIYDNDSKAENTNISHEIILEIEPICKRVLEAFIDQHDGWKKRPLFERMWVLRDFNKHASMPVDQWLNILTNMQAACGEGNIKALLQIKAPINKLVAYIIHLQDLAKGYVKDKNELEKSLMYLKKWQQDTEALESLMAKLYK
ncbi:MAG: SDR family oxidoreductase [Bacillota bacterium]|nr:SDR family oxidoreductase [Bacillota bacterium]